MRQGNKFSQWVARDPDDKRVKLGLPLELEEEWSEYVKVLWIDNQDGTYTLVPSKEI